MAFRQRAARRDVMVGFKAIYILASEVLLYQLLYSLELFDLIGTY